MSSILIVDDDIAILQMYEAAFKLDGLSVVIAKSGEEALEILKSQKPTIVLLDIMMPNMSGIEVLQKIRQNVDTSKLKVYILTNLMNNEIKAEAEKLGISKYIVKSDFTPAQVIEMVRKGMPS